MTRLFVCALGITLAAALALGGCGDSGGGDDSAALFAALGAPSALPGGGYDYNLTIAFTNDIHDQVLPLPNGRGGMARQAAILDLMRLDAQRRGTGFLAVNAGDNFEGSLFYDTNGGVTLLRLLETAGYDVIQVGNHDHQFGVQRLYDRMKIAFPGFTQNARFLWGNVNPSHMSPIGSDPAAVGATFLPAQVDQETIDAFENAFVDFTTGQIDPALMDAPLLNSKVFNQTLFFVKNGIRIGLFGIDTDEALYSSVPGEGALFIDPSGKSENLRFYSPAGSTFASDMITYLNDPDGDSGTDDGADIIIAVTHAGFDVDQQIAANAVGATGRRLDVIVGGHSHTKLNGAFDVPHAGGGKTTIVQAGAKGEFVGRLDLDVTVAANAVTVRQTRLIQVDARFPENAAAKALIAGAKSGAGGVNATWNAPFETAVTTTEVHLPGGIAAESRLGSLTTAGVLAAANAPPLLLNLDAVLVGNFVFRGDLPAGPITVGAVQETLPLHVLDRTGMTADGIDVIEFAGGVREALDPSTFPIPGPNLTNITELEYFLEIAFGIKDILNTLSGVLGISIAGIDDFVNGLQWGGIEFTVDTAAPVMHRIDPASIKVGGVPLAGQEARAYRIGISSVLARIAVPFFQLLTQVEDPPTSGAFVPFPAYDPATAATSLVTWQALRDHLQSIGPITEIGTRPGTGHPRTSAVDLTFEATSAAVVNGTVSVTTEILNLGIGSAASATLEIAIDPTPNDRTDDPDGITDAVTGAAFITLAQAPIGSVGGASAPPAGVSSPGGFTFTVPGLALPQGLSPGRYPLYLAIRNVTVPIGATPEVVTANNGLSTDPAVWITVP